MMSVVIQNVLGLCLAASLLLCISFSVFPHSVYSVHTYFIFCKYRLHFFFHFWKKQKTNRTIYAQRTKEGQSQRDLDSVFSINRFKWIKKWEPILLQSLLLCSVMAIWKFRCWFILLLRFLLQPFLFHSFCLFYVVVFKRNPSLYRDEYKFMRATSWKIIVTLIAALYSIECVRGMYIICVWVLFQEHSFASFFCFFKWNELLRMCIIFKVLTILIV